MSDTEIEIEIMQTIIEDEPNEIMLTLDLVPLSVNMMYRSYRGGIRLSKRGRKFKQECLEELDRVLIEKDTNIEKVQQLSGDLYVDITLYFDNKRKRDIDNYAKSLLDSLKGILFEDDDQIIDLRLRKITGYHRNRSEIVIRNFEA